MADDAQTPSEEPAAADPTTDAWVEALRYVARHYQVPQSTQAARQVASWRQSDGETQRVHFVGRRMGLRVKFAPMPLAEITTWNLPAIVRFADQRVAVVVSIGAAGEANLIFSGDQGLTSPMPTADIVRLASTVAIARPERDIPDVRVDAYIKPAEKNWLRKIVLSDLAPYGPVILASILTNMLGLAGVLFSMQIYDRVVPAKSFPTLYVLFSGVLLAIFFDFQLRKLRTSVVDILGKRADARMSDMIFGHALRVKNRARPTSTGSYIAQLRDLEQVREMLTSTTVSAVADIPFFLIAMILFTYIAGWLVIVPACALVLIIVPGLLAQRNLKTHASESMRESSLRNAMLIEAVQGIEDIKSLQAEERFQQQWNHFNLTAADSQLKLREISNGLITWTQSLQTLVYGSVIVLGAPRVIEGDMTTGALVAASMLGSRMMAPLSQVAQVLSKLQQAKVGLKSLNQLMRLPVDHPEAEHRVQCPRIAGHFEFKSAAFRYGDDNSPPALLIKALDIKPGEKVAVLGKNGAGKSTLLMTMSGLLEPSIGEVLLDDKALKHIDPADVRRDIGILTQNARLFYGTIRENLTLGAPHATQEEILAALQMVGAMDFIRRLPKGLDHLILEGGLGLSGGQRQALLLARLMLRQPSILLLDEPTASMDEAAERQFIQQLHIWGADKTLVIATHRMRVLELADRIIVIDHGQIALDDTKENALMTLRGITKAPRPAVVTGSLQQRSSAIEAMLNKGMTR